MLSAWDQVEEIAEKLIDIRVQNRKTGINLIVYLKCIGSRYHREGGVKITKDRVNKSTLRKKREVK
jgi:alpha-amylase/alpha-mannosidase (GH57 family)